MNSLLERARALNDERMIRRTLYQSARALDYGGDAGSKPGRFTHHILWNILIHLDGDRATAESYTATLAETPDGPLVRSMGRYLDRLIRDSNGTWRIDDREYVLECEV